MHPEGPPSGSPESPDDYSFDASRYGFDFPLRSEYRPPAPATPSKEFLEAVGPVFDYPPELSDLLQKHWDGASINHARSDAWRAHAREAMQKGDTAAEVFYLRKAEEYADLATAGQNQAENLIKAHARRQKVKSAARKIAGVIRRPLDVMPRLGHDAAAEAFIPGVEDGGLAGG